ncbi:MAG: toll/interleukin-1 receptor domain-containing protein [Candidatus Korobacteraceae bacterium]
MADTPSFAVYDEPRFAVYFSHSWRPRDVDLNLLAWRALAQHCEILVDAPEEPGANPPYYINRIEELLRRTDLFVSVLTYRDPHPGDFTEADVQLRCSPYMLFEIRLAERAEIPRLILYERRTGFRPPRNLRSWEAYIPFERAVTESLPEQRQWATVIEAKIQQWRTWAGEHRRPVSYEQSTNAVLLLDPSPQDTSLSVLNDCLSNAGYEPATIDPGKLRSSEAFRLLREAGLVVAQFGSQNLMLDQLYAAAHVLGLPAIRMLAGGAAPTDLPWILSGDPGGYQNDIVAWQHPEELPALVNPRITSMFRLSPALRDVAADDYLQSKRYSQFFVFISHTLKPPHRALVENIYTRLKQHHVTPFEYHETNTAGMDWKESLRESLQKTTHFVVLLSPEYELSATCTFELEGILARGNQVTIMPFMVAGRSVPNPKLAYMHNMLLTGENPDADAQVVVDQVMSALDRALGAP